MDDRTDPEYVSDMAAWVAATSVQLATISAILVDKKVCTLKEFNDVQSKMTRDYKIAVDKSRASETGEKLN